MQLFKKSCISKHPNDRALSCRRPDLDRPYPAKKKGLQRYNQHVNNGWQKLGKVKIKKTGRVYHFDVKLLPEISSFGNAQYSGDIVKNW
jgi:hypothetical protein